MPILLALLFLAANNAFGQFDETVLYRITAKHSGRCLAVAGGPRFIDNGVPVIQWDCIESETNQKWQVIPDDDGYYKIIARHSLKALSVFGGIISQRDGVVVQQWDDNNADNQKWEITCVGDGYYKIVAKHSHKALDIDYHGEPGELGNGPFAQQMEYGGGDNQKWKFTVSLTDLPPRRATPTICPSDAAQSRLGINIYTANTNFLRRTSFAVNETVVLRVENNTGASVFFKYAVNAEPLIREGGLQVERLINSSWFAVFPSGICGPREVRTRNPDGTVSVAYLDYPSPTQLIEFRATMNSTHRWTVPASIGSGTYRLSFVFFRSAAQTMPITVCSQTFVVR